MTKKLIILSWECLQMFSLANFIFQSRNNRPSSACNICSVY